MEGAENVTRSVDQVDPFCFGCLGCHSGVIGARNPPSILVTGGVGFGVLVEDVVAAAVGTFDFADLGLDLQVNARVA